MSLRLEVKPNRKLGDTVTTPIAVRFGRLSETAALEVVPASTACTRVLEVRVIEDVKEVGVEPERHPLVDLEALADSKINVGEHRPGQRAAAGVGVTPQPAMGVDGRIKQTVRGCSE